MADQVAPRQSERLAPSGNGNPTVAKLDHQMVGRPCDQRRCHVLIAIAGHQHQLQGHCVEVESVHVHPTACGLHSRRIERGRDGITNRGFHAGGHFVQKRISEPPHRLPRSQSHEVRAAPEFRIRLRRVPHEPHQFHHINGKRLAQRAAHQARCARHRNRQWPVGGPDGLGYGVGSGIGK